MCLCPSTEADLGDGMAPTRDFLRAGISMSLGTDGQTQTSILGEAARLEMHERLRLQQRNVLQTQNEQPAQVLMRAATVGGAEALNIEAGEIRPGLWADLVALDLKDPHLAGADDDTLLDTLMFSADSRCVRDVFVAGRRVVKDGQHQDAPISRDAFARLCDKLFASV
ncbi:MAG: amidohydrolase family protein [Myxococcota bacterium]